VNAGSARDRRAGRRRDDPARLSGSAASRWTRRSTSSAAADRALLLWLLLAARSTRRSPSWARRDGRTGRRAGVLHPVATARSPTSSRSFSRGDPPHRARARYLTGPTSSPTATAAGCWRGSSRCSLSDARSVRHAAADGLQILLQIALQHVQPARAVAIGFFVVAIFTFAAGLRGAALRASLKICCPARRHLRWDFAADPFLPLAGRRARRRAARYPGWLTIGGRRHRTGSLGSSRRPSDRLRFLHVAQSMAAIYSARDEDTLRRNRSSCRSTK